MQTPGVGCNASVKATHNHIQNSEKVLYILLYLGTIAFDMLMEKNIKMYENNNNCHSHIFFLFGGAKSRALHTGILKHLSVVPVPRYRFQNYCFFQ